MTDPADEESRASRHGSVAAESAAVQWVRRNANLIIFGAILLFVVVPRISPWEGVNDNLRIFARLSEWVLGKVEQLFEDYGYYVVFIGVLIENSMLLGLLVPGAIILILAGLAAENGSINVWYVFVLAIAATILGDTASYLIGRLGWTRVLERTGMGSEIEKVRGPMESNRVWIILTYHLAGYSRVVGPAAAGIFRIPFRRWAPLDYTGGAIWVFLYTGIGVALGLAGVDFGDTKRLVQLLEWFFLGVFALAIFIAVVRASRARDTGSGPPGSSSTRRAVVAVPADDP
jgi:membrane protein DedA with SNARE-associated domain